MNHCGEKFHSEVAKFRFLNELIKVLSPKVSTMVLALPSAPGPASRLFLCTEAGLLHSPCSLSQVYEGAERGGPRWESFLLQGLG